MVRPSQRYRCRDGTHPGHAAREKCRCPAPYQGKCTTGPGSNNQYTTGCRGTPEGTEAGQRVLPGTGDADRRCLRRPACLPGEAQTTLEKSVNHYKDKDFL